MVDTSHIDLLTLIPTKLKRVAGTGGGEWHGPCPMCGGEDRFVVQPAQGTWMCRKAEGHRASGDAITLMMEYHRMTYPEACAALGIQLEQKHTTARTRLQLDRMPAAPPVAASQPPARKPASLIDPQWIDMAQRFTDWTWRNMHSGQYPEGLQYLTSRGIDEVTADLFYLGWCPQEFRMKWGETDVYIPTGLVIPWLDEFDGTPRKINIRRMTADHGKRYIQIAGGANWLYNSWRIRKNSVVVLVEGELDAISIATGTNHHLIVPVATGSTTGARWMRWIALLAIADTVLVGFDQDEAGQNAAAWWCELLNNSKRIHPTRHDVNEMLLAGDNLIHWIEEAC